MAEEAAYLPHGRDGDLLYFCAYPRYSAYTRALIQVHHCRNQPPSPALACTGTSSLWSPSVRKGTAFARHEVLISGVGLAGDALTFCRSNLSHNVTVVERFHALRAIGLQLDLRGYGIEVLKRMGLKAPFRAN